MICTNSRFVYKINSLADVDLHLQSETCRLQDIDPMTECPSWVREGVQGVEVDISQL